MAYTRTDVINRISTVLQDPSTAIWGTAMIGQAVDDGLSEIAKYSARITLATVTPVAGTPDLDISGSAFATLLYGISVDSIDEVEFLIDKKPKRFRNFEIHGNNIVMDITFQPSGSDPARIYCKVPHILGGSGTTSLSPEMERILIELCAAKLSVDVSVDNINAINIGGKATVNDYISWGQLKLNEVKRQLVSIARPKIWQEYPKVL